MAGPNNKQRFPSDANKPKSAVLNKGAAPVAKKEEPKAEPIVEGKRVTLVQIEYKKDNHHVIEGVHALRKGINHVNKEIWDKSKKNPDIQALIKDGHLIDGSPTEEIAEEESNESDPSSESDSDVGKTDDSQGDDDSKLGDKKAE